MADEQILTARVTIPPAPSTSRGVPLRFSLNSQGQSLFYGNGSNIYIRSLDGKGTQPLKVCSLHTSLVTTVTLSPDDQCCASGDQDGNVILWSAQDTKMQRYKNRPFNSGPVLDVAWSDDSERVVAVGEGKNTFGAVYSSSTGTSLGLINGHTKNILSADFRKARPYRIATGSSDMLMCFFEGPPFKFVQSQKKHTGVVNIVRFSPDGQLLASASADKTICIYNATDGTAIGMIASGHTGSIYSLAFWRETPESSWCIVTASADKTCRVFPATDSAAARQVINFNSSEVEFMQMGVGTATGSPTAVSIGLNGDVHVLDLTDAKSSKPCCILRGHQRTISAMATNRGKSSFFTFSVDGKILRWKSSFENSSMNIDLRQSSCIAAPTVKNVSTALCISENAVLCAGNDESCATIRIDGDAESVTIHEKISGSATGSAYVTKLNTAVIITTSSIILNPDVPTKKHTIRVPYSPLSVTAIHNEIWVGSAKDHNIYVYEVKADGKADLVETLADVHRGNVSALATSTSNALVASGDTNREILIWDPVTRKPLPRARDMVFHASRVTCLAFLSTEAEGNGTSESILVSGSSDATIRVWNIHRKGEAHLTVSRAHPGGVTALVGISASEFSSSGSDATVRLWQLEEKHLKELNK